jgi:hypothetical protein
MYACLSNDVIARKLVGTYPGKRGSTSWCLIVVGKRQEENRLIFSPYILEKEPALQELAI